MQFKLFSLATLLFLSGNMAAIAQEETFPDPVDINTTDEISPDEINPENEEFEPYEFEFTIIDDILNQTIYAPFRQEGTVKESSRPAYVINRQQIEAQGYRTINEALKYFPGMFSDSSAGNRLGAQSSQIFRGATGSSQTLILLDGRPLNRFDNGSVDLSSFTTDNVERIELIPGGSSTLFGSNAVGGVINIITRQPELNSDVAVEVGTELGSFGFNKQAIAVSYGQENAAFRVAYNRTAATNDFDYNLSDLGLSGTRQNAGAEIQNLNFQALGQFGDRHKLRFNGLYSSKDIGVPNSIEFPSLNAKQYDDNWLLSLDLESRLGNGNDSTLNTRIFADFNEFYYNDQNFFGTTNAKYSNDSIGTQIQHNWQFSETQNIAYGFDYRQMTAVGFDGFSGYDEALNQGAIFARYAANLAPEFALNLGLRQDFNSLASGSFTSPSAGFLWQAGDSTSIRGNYARNFRAPTAVDLYYPGFSNPDLTPEFANGFDLGIDQRISNRALFRLTYFNNTIDDAIIYNSSISMPENIGKIRNQGLEAELTMQFTPVISAFVNYTLNDSKILKDTNSTVEGNEVPFVGANYLNLGLAYENPQGFYVGLFMKNMGDRFTNKQNSSSLPAYTTFDVRARYPISKNVNLTASVENLFDEDFILYQGFGTFPGVGRRFQVGINAKF